MLLINPLKRLSETVRDEPYLIANVIFTCVILMIAGYSLIFSPDRNNYPIVCIHEKITGEPCASCGLSHSFSLIVRGRIDEALQYNSYGLRVFLFFATQLILRIGLSVYYLLFPDTRRQLIIIDSVASGLMVLISFRQFIAAIFTGFTSLLSTAGTGSLFPYLFT